MKNGKNKTYILSATIFLAAAVVVGCGGTDSTQNNVAVSGDRAANTVTRAADNNRSGNTTEIVSNTNSNSGGPAKCTLMTAPRISGFVIGQTIESLESEYPGFKAAYDKESSSGIEGNKKANFVLLTSGSIPRGNAVEKKFPSLSFIWHFLDGKLMAIVEKDIDVEVKDENKYVADTAKRFGLPVEGWIFPRDGSAEMTCGTFSAMITTGGQPGAGIMIIDTASQALKNERMKK